MSFHPYRRYFQMVITEQMTYRANYFFGFLRQALLYSVLIFLYRAMPNGMAAYSQQELLSYTVMNGFVSALIFFSISGTIAGDIAGGDLSKYLVRPLSYFGEMATWVSAGRAIYFVTQLIAMLIILFSFRISLQLPHTALQWILAMFVLGGAMALYTAFDFFVGACAFVTKSPYGGLSWAALTLLSFGSGSYVPTDALPHFIQRVLAYTPFPLLSFAPTKAFIGAMETKIMLQMFAMQCVWLVFFVACTSVLWRWGVRHYEAYGN